MGSRYDIAVFRGTTLDRFARAISDRHDVGAAVSGPWAGRSDVAVAQVDVGSTGNVVVTAPPMRMPRGIDTLLAERLGSEVLFATVWDSVSSYSLTVVGEGVDRYRSVDVSDDEGGDPSVEDSGERLPEEPEWPELDEAYIQAVFEKRCGIDPGRLRSFDASWHALEPRPKDEPRKPAAADSP